MHIFTTPEDRTTSVTFFLKDPQGNSALVKTENTAPYDMFGTLLGGTAQPLYTSQLIPGSYTVTAEIVQTDGNAEAISAAFTVIPVQGGSVPGPRVFTSHEAVIPNQDLTITGDGFIEPSGADVCIQEGGITLNGVALEIVDDDNCPLPGADGILVTSGGSFTLTVRIVQADIPAGSALDSALMQEGVHELKVVDSAGVQVSLQVTIPDREISVSPLSARLREIVTIIGRQFVANNSDGVPTRWS